VFDLDTDAPDGVYSVYYTHLEDSGKAYGVTVKDGKFVMEPTLRACAEARNEAKYWGTFLEGLEPDNLKKHKKEFYKRCELPKDLQSPMVILIFGNKVAQILWQKQSFAFVLESEKIKQSFMKYFHYFWKE